MQFFVSEQKVRKDRRWAIGLVIVLLLGSLAMLVKMVRAETVSELLLPAIVLLVFALVIFASYRHIKQGVDAYLSVTLDESNHQAAMRFQGEVVNIDLLQVKYLRYQTRFKRIKSVVLRADTGHIFKLIGFEDMDVLIATLERLVPADRVSSSAFLHQ